MVLAVCELTATFTKYLTNAGPGLGGRPAASAAGRGTLLALRFRGAFEGDSFPPRSVARSSLPRSSVQSSPAPLQRGAFVRSVARSSLLPLLRPGRTAAPAGRVRCHRAPLALWGPAPSSLVSGRHKHPLSA